MSIDPEYKKLAIKGFINSDFSYQNLFRRHHAAKRVAGISGICNDGKIPASSRSMVEDD